MIRLATAADVDALAALESGSMGRDAWAPSSVLSEVVHPARVVLVADHGGAVGYVSVGVVDDLADVHRVVVDVRHRRRGHARLLLRAGTTAARERGATRVLLDVAADNAAALALYRAEDFRPISRRRGYYAGGVDALVLERVI